MRKTVKIAELVATVNLQNATSTCCHEMRKGWNSSLAGTLLSVGAYKGYGYLTASQVPQGCEPGIAFEDAEGNTITAEEFYAEYERAGPKACTFKRVFPDESRRVYYS